MHRLLFTLLETIVKFVNSFFIQALFRLLLICLLMLFPVTPTFASPVLNVFTIAPGDIAGLIAAINTANSNGVSDAINLSAGVYTLTAVDNTSITGPNGLPVIASEITVIGADAASTILQRDGAAPNFRFFEVINGGNLTLTDLTVRNSGTTAIYNNEGMLTILNGIFFDNIGGGIFNNAGALTIANSTFTRNSGAGISIRGSTAMVTNSSFTENLDNGIYNGLFGNLTVIDSSFTNNSAVRGGGIHSTQSTNLTVINSTFTGNSASEGGGVYNEGLTLIVNSTFIGNTANQEGGGLYFECGSFSYGCEMAVINSSFYGNSAERGGGINFDDGRPFTLINSTIAGNTASISGGGIRDGGTTSIVNSILWGNSVAGGTVLEGQISQNTATVRYSLIQDDDPLDASIPFGGAANNNIDDDPLFVRNPDHGGDGWGIGNNDDYGDLRLQSNSPAIDAGSNALVPADTVDLDRDSDTTEATPLDLDGNPRFVNGIVDMGAYEFQQNQPPVCDEATSNPEALWPPNHQFVPITILGAIDPDGDPVSITIDSIFQDEPVNTPASEDLSPDGQGVGTSTAQVRAERVDSGNGRVYHISFTADDEQGGTCSGEVLVGVPHKKKDVSTDDGALYNSTLGTSAAAMGPADDKTHDNAYFLPLVAK